MRVTGNRLWLAAIVMSIMTLNVELWIYRLFLE